MYGHTMIRVGIPTAGEPELQRTGGRTLLHNMRIGLGFHWERTIEAELPGELMANDDPVYRLVNLLPLETYLECVVGSEMNPHAPAEFLKAHAIISRSWALGKIIGRPALSDNGKISRPDLIVDWEDTCDHSGFHVCSDDHCQRYQGFQPIPMEIREAIRSTAGEILVSPSGRLVDARFSKCCGGHTEVFSTCWQDREEACLESFVDPWCDLSGLSPADRKRVLESVLKDYDLSNGGGYEWTAECHPEEIRQRLMDRYCRDIGEIRDISVTRRGPSGRASRLMLTGSSGKFELGKELMIRRLLSGSCLYSSAFTIEKDRDSFQLHGHGWGHGVGLCQIGAARMALEGHDYRDILSFYYPGSTLSQKNRRSEKSAQRLRATPNIHYKR